MKNLTNLKDLTKEELLNEVLIMSKKYESLVKYARVNPEHILEHKRLKDFMIKTENDFTDEVIKLSGEEGDWYHGFNSGALSAFRYIMTMNYVDKHTADEWFPELHT